MGDPNRSRTDLVDRLRNRIRQFETARRVDDEVGVSSGCTAIDGLLPAGGYPRGALVQWLSGGGQGASYLSLLAAKEACEAGGALVVFDPQNEFFPPAAAAIGINLDHLIILRSESPRRDAGEYADGGRARGDSRQALSNDFLWSIDQALRCPAVGAVWGALGGLDERWFRRFQLSAESSGSLGLLIQPIQEARRPSWAEVQWLVRPLDSPSQFSGRPGSSDASFSSDASLYPEASSSSEASFSSSATEENSLQVQRVGLQLARCRGTSTGKSISLSINTITGSVRRARQEYGHRQEGEIRENQNNKGHASKGRNGQPRNYSRGDSPPGIAESGGQAGALPVVSQLGDSTAGRQRA